MTSTTKSVMRCPHCNAAGDAFKIDANKYRLLCTCLTCGYRAEGVEFVAMNDDDPPSNGNHKESPK